MNWRERLDRIENMPGLTHRGKYDTEQVVMRRILDEYEEQLKHPFRLLIRHLLQRKRLT